ncbi:hypothetical protein NHH03_10405 [Stieleria sp. TO1_6]|nr:hypothetical protein [Stieleria tagensis]
MKRVLGLDVSTNTIERVALEVGNDLEAAEQEHWQKILTGEVSVPSLAIVAFDGGRIRTRKIGCGPGVHLDAKGWNETKNATFVSATSETSEVDPQPEPPTCFLDADHVAKLTEKAKTKENAGSDDSLPQEQEDPEQDQACKTKASHKPQRLLRTVIASMKNSKQFGDQMAREAKRRRFDEAPRKAYVADGLTCNWTIHAEHFHDYTAILDFTHAVTYLFTASLLCFGKTDEAWNAYLAWMTKVWQGDVGLVIAALKSQQTRVGTPPADAEEDDPREQLRRVIGYLENNQDRMRYDEYRMRGLPTTSAWMESAVKEMNYRTKGTEMFWNNPAGAEAILQIRAAALSDDDRLVRLLSHRPGQSTLRRSQPSAQAA